MNNGHEDAFVKWKIKGKDQSLFVKAKGKARRMMTIHGGNPKPVSFSAYSKENNKQLAVNREKSVQFRPRLHKFYNFIRIDGKSEAILHNPSQKYGMSEKLCPVSLATVEEPHNYFSRFLYNYIGQPGLQATEFEIFTAFELTQLNQLYLNQLRFQSIK